MKSCGLLSTHLASYRVTCIGERVGITDWIGIGFEQMMIPEFCDWLSHTAASNTIANVTWIIPATQTVHIMAVTVVMAPMMMFDLRMMGIAGRQQSISQVADRFIPPIWPALLVLLATGTILTIGEPGRELLSDAFRLKMMLVATVSIITYYLQRKLRRDRSFWDNHRAAAVSWAVISLLLWLTIATCGRWIAYLSHG